MKAVQQIGIDLGGTKCAIGVLDHRTEWPNIKLLSFREFPSFESSSPPLNTKADREDWLNSLCQNISRFVEDQIGDSDNETTSIQIGMGSPGKIISGRIVAGTAPQFGESLNDFNLQEALQQRLQNRFGDRIELKLRNDALAQLLFGIYYFSSQKDFRSFFVNQSVGYLGPGTGLGGGFAKVIESNQSELGLQVEFFTDGHVGDVELPTGEVSEADLISGMAIQKCFGVSAKVIAQDLEKYKEPVQQIGKNLGRLIEAFATGAYKKTRPTTLWTQAEVDKVKEVRTYLLGGSIGTKDPLASYLRETASQYLRSRLNHEINLLSLPQASSEAAVIGSYYLSEVSSEV